MKVSVCMITYNHEKFIAQAVESVMTQEAGFDYELVIGEDCSTDGTRQVVVELQKKYPGKIRLLLPHENLGMNRNLAQTLQACRGEYVALIEGDDYWTSPQKLQKQVGVLDESPEDAMCFHDVRGFYSSTPEETWEMVLPNLKRDLVLHDLLEGVSPPTCSVMLRRSLIPEFPEWFYSKSVGDWPLWIFVGLSRPAGQVRYIDEPLAAYRVHEGGVWSSINGLKRTQNLYEVARAFLPHLSSSQQKQMMKIIVRCWCNFVAGYIVAGQWGKANRYARWARRRGPLYIARTVCGDAASWTHTLRVLLLVYVPDAYRLARAVKKMRRAPFFGR